MRITPQSIRKGYVTNPQDLNSALNEFSEQARMLSGEVAELDTKVKSQRQINRDYKEALKRAKRLEKDLQTARQLADKIPELEQELTQAQHIISKNSEILRESATAKRDLKDKVRMLEEYQRGIRDIETAMRTALRDTK